jgi:hypothetical protein
MRHGQGQQLSEQGKKEAQEGRKTRSREDTSTAEEVTDEREKPPA